MSGKYWEKYQEKKLKLDRLSKTPTHMTDKQSYIISLESQLDHSNHSSMLISTFSERIEQLQKQLNTAEERIANLMRLFKLQGTEVTENLHGGYFSKLEERISALEQSHKIKAESYKTFSDSVDFALKDTEKRIAKLIEEFEEKYKKSSPAGFSFGNNEFFESLSKEKEKAVKEAAENAWLAQQTCSKLAEDTIDRLAGCERRIKDVKKIMENYEPNVEDIEAKVTAKLDSSIENLSNLIKGYVKTQEQITQEFKEFKEKLTENKDPGVFSFGSTSFKPEPVETKQHTRIKSESNSREQSKEADLKNTRKRSSSPSAKAQTEKKVKVKKDEIKIKKKTERNSRLEKLYQNFSEKNI